MKNKIMFLNHPSRHKLFVIQIQNQSKPKTRMIHQIKYETRIYHAKKNALNYFLEPNLLIIKNK